MKKILTSIAAGLMISAQVLAVSVKDVCGRFNGDLNIGGTPYPNKSVYLLPGVVDNTVTFVLPDFMFNAGKLGNIVLPNIPMSANGQLTLENATLYLDSISERATITVVNGLEDGGQVYNSIVTASEAQVILSIAAPSLVEPIYVLFAGQAVKTQNYVLPNSGFEGEWTNNEPEGWHSFGSACGLFVDFIKENTFQFVQSDVVRPGSAGSHSALISSNIVMGVKANGNCTNGQVNAGSMTATDSLGNYNFSDPDSAFVTPFHGRPDSIVFWAKYQPADLNPSNEVNQARLNAVITTNARYQDPESNSSHAACKIGAATLNYSANADMSWQRLAVPFVYEANKADQAPAYILATFSTNKLPGGGSSYTTGGTFAKQNILDSVYIDDVEIIYNHALSEFKKGQNVLPFVKGVATDADNYCDDCAKFAATSEGITAQAFIAYDAVHKCIFIYVIADDYAQSGAYNLYRVEFADSDTSDLNPKEAIEFVHNEKASFEKVIINGRLFIRSNDAMYDILGKRIK